MAPAVWLTFGKPTGYKSTVLWARWHPAGSQVQGCLRILCKHRTMRYPGPGMAPCLTLRTWSCCVRAGLWEKGQLKMGNTLNTREGTGAHIGRASAGRKSSFLYTPTICQALCWACDREFI